MNTYIKKAANEILADYDVDLTGVSDCKKYELPTRDSIPSDYYFAFITCIQRNRAKSGRIRIDVFYKIYNSDLCFYGVNGYLSKNEKVNPYYIKQRYIEGTPRYCSFVKLMDDVLLSRGETSDIEKVTNVTISFRLRYRKGVIVGKTEKEKLFDFNDFFSPVI